MDQTTHDKDWGFSQGYQVSFRRLRALHKEVLTEEQLSPGKSKRSTSGSGLGLGRWIVFLALVTLVSGGGYFAYTHFLGGSRGGDVRPSLPAFEANLLDLDGGSGTRFYSSTLVGKTVTVFFWQEDDQSADWLRALRGLSESGPFATANSVVVCSFVGSDRNRGIDLARRYGSDKLVFLDESGVSESGGGAGAWNALGQTEAPALYLYDAFGRLVAEEIAPEQLEMALAGGNLD
ncbi:TlpA family protein disulfide reductase [Pelagicoccus mobilis]|uniref:Thioredoxin domain-containing protein n=1 Tax=Pelagicoccus mobilis TaxID=415221 RepID=A0A934S2S3_9BACT|nr:hypothetical protein [Pelagicoccus mobilis]MBK1877998.1 hypothetical protein [Pelagicoccus mobilis]